MILIACYVLKETMSKTITLKAVARELIGKKVKQLRKQNMVPAVMYGNKIEAQNLAVNYLDFSRVYDKAGESALVEVEVAGKKVNALIHDIQLDPMSGRFTHVDFFQVNMKEEVETEIPLEFVGESDAVKALGGVLVKNMDAVTVKCLPADLPEKFVVDIAKLATFEDVFTVADLKTSDKVEIILEDETVIAMVSEPRSEEELAGLDQKVEEDVTKVAGVVKEASEADKK
jgi:large subunit ribosomal protein L25